MTTVQYSNRWFDQILSSLFEWGDFFLALRTKIARTLALGHLGLASGEVKFSIADSRK
jgi:hypothetical protein